MASLWMKPGEDSHSVEKHCDVVSTHAHKLYIISEMVREKGSLKDIIALKTKEIRISADMVGAYCYVWEDK